MGYNGDINIYLFIYIYVCVYMCVESPATKGQQVSCACAATTELW